MQILITVNVSAENKTVPTGAPTLSTDTIVYGTKLGTITLSGALRDEENDKDVPGTFSWNEPDAVLDAGSHQAEWTFTPEDTDTHLETSGTAEVTVNKAAAACTAPTANDLTYDSTAQALVAAGSTAHGEMRYSLTDGGAYSTAIPTVTSLGYKTVDGGKVTGLYSTEENGTYDAYVPAFTDAGTYTVYFKVRAAEHEEANGSFTVTILPRSIADAKITLGEALTYNGQEQTQTITSVTVDGLTVTYDVPGNTGKDAGDYTLTVTGTGNFTGTAERKFVIGKAAAPAVAPIRVDVTNDYAADYTVDLRAALNAVLPKGCSFGTVQYGTAQYSDAAGYCDRSGSAISGQGILTLAVNKVTTANYQDITVTVELYAVNKAVPTSTPSLSRNRLSYGETLSAIRLWGSMRSGNAWVSGTFTWAEPNLRPESGTYTATWVFTHTDDKYASVTGTVDITVAEPPVTVPTYKVGGIVKSFSVTGGTPGGSSQPVKSAETGDIGLLPYATMTLSACTGVVVLRFRRKRED